MEEHALVFGASGIQGWAVTNQLLHDYPASDSFARITALTHRPLTNNSLWPECSKLEVVSGIDLLGSSVEQDLEEKVAAIGTVSHVFFLAFIYDENPEEETRINVTTLQNAVTAVEKLSRSLKFVVLSTGLKIYGTHLLSDFPYHGRLPLSEDLPRIPKPWCDQLFYYFQTDFLAEQSRGKKWTYCELRPDTIVGFVPNNNFFCLAQVLAKFLALYREINGEGAECAFPGSEGAWRCLNNDSGQDTIARFAIDAALHPEVCGRGQAFNIASHSVPSSWSEKWPILCKFFGLKGMPPNAESGIVASRYLSEHRAEWEKMEQDHHLMPGHAETSKTSFIIDMGILTVVDYDRQANLSKAHQAWSLILSDSAEQMSIEQVWWTAFQRFRNAKIIP